MINIRGIFSKGPSLKSKTLYIPSGSMITGSDHVNTAEIYPYFASDGSRNTYIKSASTKWSTQFTCDRIVYADVKCGKVHADYLTPMAVYSYERGKTPVLMISSNRTSSGMFVLSIGLTTTSLLVSTLLGGFSGDTPVPAQFTYDCTITVYYY